MVRIDLWRLYTDGLLVAQQVIDLSTLEARRRYWTKAPMDYGDWAEMNFSRIDLAESAKEVLIMWRGQVPTSHFAVVSCGVLPGLDDARACDVLMLERKHMESEVNIRGPSRPLVAHPRCCCIS